ncbi:MAG: penicillin-binding protein [Chloroflexaceae bacterium]|nr:penicillin-binding protein [Chloroflexaceae bacterium]
MAPRTTELAHPRFSPIRFAWRLLLALVKLTLLGFLVMVAAGMGLYYQYGRDLPDPQEIGQHHSLETTRLYASDGKTLLYELVDPQSGKRTVVPFDRIPRTIKDATIAVEDAGFYDHPGVDWRGIVRAIWLNYTHQEIVSGGSTIPQQLVRTILLPRDPGETDTPVQVRYEQKVREAILAFQISHEYSKDQLLSLYLNEVYYGAQAYGVEAAAQTYFGKHVWDLNDAEATLIAGLPQSPTLLNPFTDMEGARARQRITLDLMVKYGYITPLQADYIFDQPITLTPPSTHILAPHFVYYVLDQLEQGYGPEVLHRGGLRVVTTIDLELQAQAEAIVREQVAALRSRNVSNAGAVMLNESGQVIAMVGSIDYDDPSIPGQVNVTIARRQPGSALKPLVYAAAMQQGWTPATVIWDVPSEFRRPDGSAYVPLNYDNSWHGPQRLRMALANSLNIPAVKALEFVQIDHFVALAEQLGITTFDDPARYGLAMALGSNEVRLIELVGAYHTFRNEGHYKPPAVVLTVTNSRGEILERWSAHPGAQVLGPQGEQIAYLITDMLSDNRARWMMFGRGNVMELPDNRPAAVKTGTSNDWRDSWTVGYTPQATIGVWVGNNDNSPMQEIAGSNGSGLIWRELMLAYHEDKTPQPFPRPEGVVEQAICADTGAMASDACSRQVSELFVAGSEPQEADVTYQTLRVGGNGTCLAAWHTPTHEVRKETFAVYPESFRDWAIRHGIPQPPTETCAPPAPAAVALARLKPVGDIGMATGRQVLVRGTARGPYRLEVGVGRNPPNWMLISEGDGSDIERLLGIWRTAEIPPGPYTLRLQVMAPDGSRVEDFQEVWYGGLS